MGLFVLKSSNSTLDKAKAALANLELDVKTFHQCSDRVTTYAIPYLKELIKKLELERDLNTLPDRNIAPADRRISSMSFER
jgi:hypothetical protein